MALLTIITMLAIIEYIYFGMKVGKARGEYGIAAPAVTGHEMFERHYRVQMNTLEQIVIFLPALWAFGHYVNHYAAALFGLIYLFGRMIYAIKYIEEPSKRGVGMMMTMIPSMLMIMGGLLGAVYALLQ
ncbi:MAG: MAPEG family protein [Pseudomonadales bacterium]|jgi:glutathione S-transferase|nr:MAPEG family protein [Pseudomonadales bacterium]MDG1444706.1 MAPEG family protein [Pseudomonadales bacterium]